MERRTWWSWRGVAPILSVLLVIGVLLAPLPPLAPNASAAGNTTGKTGISANQPHSPAAAPKNAATMLNATFYITRSTLMSIFQNRLNQQVPGAVNNAITSIVNKLPASSRGWILQMAMTLIQPSAKLVQLTPQQNGLATTLSLSLFPNDPSPITARMLIQFSVLDSATAQITAKPLPGSPTLINGPLTTVKIPLGQLSSINSTPSCGDSALAVNLQVPVSLGQQQEPSTGPGEQGYNWSDDSQDQPLSMRMLAYRTAQLSNSSPAFVEIPANSLSALAANLGTISLGNNLSAQNIQLTVQNRQVVVTSDIMFANSFRLATATTLMQPITQGGNLAVNVLKTTLTIFQVFTFPYDNYNSQIQQMLDSKLSGALAGKFFITSVNIGSNSHLPCAASDSLVLAGTTNSL